MIINKNPFAAMKKLEDEYYIICNNKVFLLEGISPFIWDNIEDGVTLENLLEKILNEYDVSEKKARKDLEKIIARLEKIGAIDVD
ncbi:PqqD family protein [Weizmannia sp. FSL K6-0777]|jgi:CRISPR/Cas system-associated exonuclease Cas4 (RecB family)|uniref:PqqD family protein n=1 Tax=Weizmannia sp. FSL K6-0777 TaxID=2954674 RepID=UPI0031584A50